MNTDALLSQTHFRGLNYLLTLTLRDARLTRFIENFVAKKKRKRKTSKETVIHLIFYLTLLSGLVVEGDFAKTTFSLQLNFRMLFTCQNLITNNINEQTFNQTESSSCMLATNLQPVWNASVFAAQFKTQCELMLSKLEMQLWSKRGMRMQKMTMMMLSF